MDASPSCSSWWRAVRSGRSPPVRDWRCWHYSSASCCGNTVDAPGIADICVSFGLRSHVPGCVPGPLRRQREPPDRRRGCGRDDRPSPEAGLCGTGRRHGRHRPGRSPRRGLRLRADRGPDRARLRLGGHERSVALGLCRREVGRGGGGALEDLAARGLLLVAQLLPQGENLRSEQSSTGAGGDIEMDPVRVA